MNGKGKINSYFFFLTICSIHYTCYFDPTDLIFFNLYFLEGLLKEDLILSRILRSIYCFKIYREVFLLGFFGLKTFHKYIANTLF